MSIETPPMEILIRRIAGILSKGHVAEFAECRANEVDGIKGDIRPEYASDTIAAAEVVKKKAPNPSYDLRLFAREVFQYLPKDTPFPKSSTPNPEFRKRIRDIILHIADSRQSQS